MDFGEMFRAIRQQWVVATVAALLTLVAIVGVYLAWPAKYQSTAQITLVGSSTLATQTGNGNNAYLTVGNLTPLAGILATNLSSDQAAKQLKALGVTDPYTFEVPATATGPFLAITVTGADKAKIVRSVWTIINFSAQRLIQLQTNTSIPIPKKSLIQAQVMAQPTAATPVLKTKVEVVAGVAVVCIVLSLLLIFGLENARIRRTAKPTRRRPVRTAGEPVKPVTIEQYTGQKAATAGPQPTGTEPELVIPSAAADPFPAPEPEIISRGARQGTSRADSQSASPAGDLTVGASDGRDGRGISFWDSDTATGRAGSPADDPDSSRGIPSWDRRVVGDLDSSRGIGFWDSSPAGARGAGPADEPTDGPADSARDGGESQDVSAAGDAGSSRGTSIWDSGPATKRSASPADEPTDGPGGSARDGGDSQDASAAGDAGSSRGTSIWDRSPASARSGGPAGDPGASEPDGGDSGGASQADEDLDDDWRDKTVPSIPVIR